MRGIAWRNRMRVAVGVALAVIAVSAHAAEEADRAVRRMVRRVLDAPEATSRVLLERSDPFGGPPDRERGRLWFLPGRGLRYRTEGTRGQDLVVDRVREAFLLYSPSERVVYRAPFARAPARIRRLILEPEQVLERDLRAVAERRVIDGRSRPGYRIRTGSLDESSGQVSVWIGPDPSSGLPRWIAIASDADSLLVELQGLSLRKSARPADLELSAPRGTREEPMDPRELLRQGEGESR